MELREIQKLVYGEYVKNGFEDKWNKALPEYMGDLAELGLIHTEISEAMEEIRNGYDIGAIKELAGAIIRILNFVSRKSNALEPEKRYLLDIENIIMNEHESNMKRPKYHGRKNI